MGCKGKGLQISCKELREEFSKEMYFALSNQSAFLEKDMPEWKYPGIQYDNE